jgi:hypothetical protein
MSYPYISSSRHFGTVSDSEVERDRKAQLDRDARNARRLVFACDVIFWGLLAAAAWWLS